MTLKHTTWIAAFAAATLSLGAAYAEDPTPPSTTATPEQRDSMPPAQQSTEPSAADPTTADRAAPATAAATPIDDKKIEQFADAYLAVQSIQQKAANELQTASDPADADKVKAKAETAMIAAVEKSGLNVDEFNRIVETMTADATVRERVSAEIQKRTGGG